MGDIKGDTRSFDYSSFLVVRDQGLGVDGIGGLSFAI